MCDGGLRMSLSMGLRSDFVESIQCGVQAVEVYHAGGCGRVSRGFAVEEFSRMVAVCCCEYIRGV